MRTLIIGFILFLCWTSVCRWHYVCKVRNQCGYEQVTEDARTKTLNLVDNGKNIIKGYDEFRFDPKAVEPTLNANNLDFINEVADYLKENPGKKMLITGNYLATEVDTIDGKPKSYGFFENLGVARADAIRQLLVEAGIPEDRLDLNHDKIKEGNTLENPISFTSSGKNKLTEDNGKDSSTADTDTEGNPDEFNTGGQSFTFTNMSFSDANFDYNSDIFKPGPAFRAYADSVKTYLTKETDKSLLLTGHTCDKGSDKYNLDLGKRRANSVQKYFKNLDVEAKITTASDGENNPAYSNATEDSRAKNRRVVVKIK